MDEYITVKGFASASFTVKKSEFIGYISPALNNDDAIAFINRIRSEHRKATHNVYAYIIREGNTSRYSDDGEPQGTAGVPVLEVLQKEGLTNVCSVVTRYFGGIMLGGGGLFRAYSHSAVIAIEAAEKLVMCTSYPLTLIFDYSLYGKISHIFPEYQVKIENTEFSTDVKIKLFVKENIFENFHKKLVNITNGQIKIYKENKKYENFN